jgi:hypothetical protein
MTADDRGVDARVDGSAVKREQATFAVAVDANLRIVLVLCKPINHRENPLNFVADDVPAHLIGHAVDELTMRLVGEAFQLFTARPRVLAVDQRRNDNAIARFGKYPCELTPRGQALRQPYQHLRRLIRIWNRHDTRLRFPFRFEQKPLAPDARQHRPANGMDLEALAFTDK